MEKKQMIVRLEGELLRQFRSLTVLKETTIQAEVEKMVKDWIEKNSKS